MGLDNSEYMGKIGSDHLEVVFDFGFCSNGLNKELSARFWGVPHMSQV